MTLGEPEPVTTGVSNDPMHLTLSADGKRLVYAVLDNTSHIMKVWFDPSTKSVVGESISVTEGSGLYQTADVSPAGESLVVQRGGIQRDLFIVGVDGTGLRPITNDAYNDHAPRWSPDGSRILFYSDSSGSYQLAMINPDGSGFQQLTNAAFDLRDPIPDPDGSRLAYNDVRRRGGAFTMETGKAWDEQSPVKLPLLTDGDESFLASSWSPDGKWLAGYGNDPTRTAVSDGIYIYSFESDEYEKLTSTGRRPRWLSDSRTLLYADRHGLRLRFHIHSVDRLSREVREVLPAGDGHVFNPVLSPDNRTLYYEYQAPRESDIWMIELPDDPQ